MKRISRFLFLSIFLASCADAATPIQIPTLTAIKEATATSTPTNTPEPTPTATPRPEGAPTDADAVYNEKDNTWHKTVETWFVPADAVWVPAFEAGPGLEGWYVSHGGSPMIRHEEGGFTQDYIPLRLEINENMSGPMINYEYDESQVTESILKKLFLSNFRTRYFNEGHEKVEFDNSLKEGKKISIPFLSTDGNEHEFNPDMERGVIVRVVDLTTAQNDPRFLKEDLTDSKVDLYVYTTGDGGNIISYIAPTVPFSSMTPKEIRQALLFSLISVSIGSDQTHGDYSVNNRSPKRGTDLNLFSEQAAKGNPPYIDFELPPTP